MMSERPKPSASEPRTPLDPRLVRAARYVSAQMNASVALEIVHDLTQLLRESLRQSARDPRRGEAHHLLGMAYECLANRRIGWEHLQRTRARRHYREALKQLPAGSAFASAANFALSANLAWDGKYPEVHRLLSPVLQSSDTMTRIRACITLGVAAFRSGRTEQALDHWQVAHRLTSEDASSSDTGLPGSWLRWAYRHLAERHLRRRKYDLAYQYSHKLVSLHDMFIDVHDFRLHALICEKSRRREEGLEALDTALALAAHGETETPVMHMGEERVSMPDWGYAYDRLYDQSGSFDSDLQK